MRANASRQFAERYLEAAAKGLSEVRVASVERIAMRILDAHARGAQVFLAGNGGSAALASHFACDLAKSVLGRKIDRKRKRVRVLSLSDNVSLMTAWANDESYECIFAEQLRGLARKGDLLIVITASGNSPNILAALDAAQELGVETVGLLGFGGGIAKDRVGEHIIVDSDDYGIVEAIHGTITHLLTAWIGFAMSQRLRVVTAKAA